MKLRDVPYVVDDIFHLHILETKSLTPEERWSAKRLNAYEFEGRDPSEFLAVEDLDVDRFLGWNAYVGAYDHSSVTVYAKKPEDEE